MSAADHNDLRPATRTEVVADRIRTGILDGSIEAGSRLRQVEIAERFGFSVTPIREAFALLRQEGLLVGDPHRGVVVFRPTVEDLTDVYEIRASLEGLAARRSVSKISPADLERLRRIHHDMEAVKPEDVEAYVALNAEFHSLLYAAGSSERLLSLIEGLRDAALIYLRFLGADQHSADRGHEEHARILAAFEAGDADEAATAVTAHLNGRLKEFLEILAD
jgi:DNA-binding GntR family transcriptional regulator